MILLLLKGVYAKNFKLLCTDIIIVLTYYLRDTSVEECQNKIGKRCDNKFIKIKFYVFLTI